MVQPLDIKTQKFKKGLFGYKTIEVDDFVNSVYRAYDELFKEHAQMTDTIEKLNASLQENRLKLFDMENKVRELEAVSGDDVTAKKKADDIIRNAESEAAQIVGKATEQGKKFESSSKKATPDKAKESATAKFFKKDENAPVASDDDDEIFVGEIEDARKRDRMMIGDGEEEEDMDFEFL
ncbi:MAG: DivIVA domain-containing protein [Eubacteriales bacterium]|nr:DivIVA domain-containing protein [Lachnospiraceae bacterium]MDO5127768.1 DivIVA domain-containing protein [Eubacteriales bacterium]